MRPTRAVCAGREVRTGVDMCLPRLSTQHMATAGVHATSCTRSRESASVRSVQCTKVSCSHVSAAAISSASVATSCSNDGPYFRDPFCS